MDSVYPRWRGEHLGLTHFGEYFSGLSPLARGTLVRFRPVVIKSRFIPAGAGNTNRAARIARWRAVYPRWRGEHNRMLPSKRRLFGLSPLARGTHSKARKANLRQRFIPAGAGNTDADHQSGGYQPVYPRWRGEHVVTSSSSFFSLGLSPLARGTLGNLAKVSEGYRFIPAGAGNTSARNAPLSWHTVYPRWRGEHFKTGSHFFHPTGLSPLARGTQAPRQHAVDEARFIPAGAGNTYISAIV